MTIRALIAAGGLALASAAGIVAAGQTMIAGQSEIAYVGTQMGVPVEGNFGRFQGRIDLHPDQPQASSVSFTVDTNSVIFDPDDVRRELVKPDWLDTARFPTAEFRSSRVRALGPDRFEIGGTLTIKGQTRDVVIPVSLSRSGAVTFAAGQLSIKRLDYGIGRGEWGDTSLVADEVQIRFKISLTGLAPG